MDGRHIISGRPAAYIEALDRPGGLYIYIIHLLEGGGGGIISPQLGKNGHKDITDEIFVA